MTLQIRHKKTVLLVPAVLVVIAVLVSLHARWNTNVRGADSFCDGLLTSKEVQAALSGPGRVSEVSSSSAGEGTLFSCTVERTSRFTGTADARMTVRTNDTTGAFPYTTNVWKYPAARSYFTGGAVSDHLGYAILPEKCWGKAVDIRGSRVVLPGLDGTMFIEARVEEGQADREGVARILSRSARDIAAAAGCSNGEKGAFDGLSSPAAWRASDPGAICGLDGLTLPESTLFKGVVEVGREQVNDASTHWACDLDLKGTSGSRLSFAATTDPDIIAAAKRERRFWEALPEKQGYAGISEAVLHCEKGDVHFSTRRSFEYDGVLLKKAPLNVPTYAAFGRATFQNFLNAAAPAYSCPKPVLPS
ncbi:hypothetical protein [Streptomyces californicus]|uniref:hypothetical protein n=1 Tax=Streptomyces californicus TaxID=67351 RepID=UPI0037A07806